MKNRAITRMLSAGMFLSILLTGTGFAVSEETMEQAAVMKKEATLIALQDDLLIKNTKEVGLDVVTEVKNLDRYQEAVKEELPEMSDLELGKEILLAGGYKLEEIEKFPEEKIIEALQYTEITRTGSFIRQRPSGERIPMDKESFYKSVEKANKKERELAFENMMSALYQGKRTNDLTIDTNEEKTSADVFSDIVWDQTEYPNDGYIELYSSANKYYPSYAEKGRAYYVIHGSAGWVKTPFWWKTDILAIASEGKIDNNYESSGMLYYNLYCNDHNTYVDHSDMATVGNTDDGVKVYNPSLNGLAIEGRLLCGEGGHPTCGFVKEKSRTYFFGWYGIKAQLDANCQVAYSHQMIGVTDSISVGISLSGSGPSISFGTGITTTHSDYYGRVFSVSGGDINYK